MEAGSGASGGGEGDGGGGLGEGGGGEGEEVLEEVAPISAGVHHGA